MLAAFFVFGMVAEGATLYTRFLGIPLFAASPLVIAVFVSARAGGREGAATGGGVRV